MAKYHVRQTKTFFPTVGTLVFLEQVLEKIHFQTSNIFGVGAFLSESSFQT